MTNTTNDDTSAPPACESHRGRAERYYDAARRVMGHDSCACAERMRFWFLADEAAQMADEETRR